MGKSKFLYGLTISKSKKAILKDEISGSITEFILKEQRAWQLKMYMEKMKWIAIPWDKMIFTEKKDVLKDYNYVFAPYDKKNRIIKISENKEFLSMEDRALILQHEYTTGRWGQNIADAEINSTKDYVILNRYDHEIDYMFSESVNSDYWIYNLKTMKEFKIEEDMTYRYLNNSTGVRESGVDSVHFSKENPYEVLIKYSDYFGENKEVVKILLPHD